MHPTRRPRAGCPRKAQPRAEPVSGTRLDRGRVGLSGRSEIAEGGDALFGSRVTHPAAVESVLDVEGEAGTGSAIGSPGGGGLGRV